jgi:hypothetical protein
MANNNINLLTAQQQNDLWAEIKKLWLHRTADTRIDGTRKSAPDLSHDATAFQTFVTAHNV